MTGESNCNGPDNKYHSLQLDYMAVGLISLLCDSPQFPSNNLFQSGRRCQIFLSSQWDELTLGLVNK